MENEKVLQNKARQWLKTNQNLLRKHKGEWIAYNGELGIIAHDQQASIVMKAASAKGVWHVIKYLNPYTYSGLRRLVPIHFRPLHIEVWEPNAIVTLQHKDISRQIEMLVDSGADISTISLQVGQELGLAQFEDEVVDLAAGVNGTVEYVLRKVKMTVEGHSFTAPIAWLLDPNCEELLLGREVVFDQFDIEFKQKEETILFKLRIDAST
jgi:hypothetical protein